MHLHVKRPVKRAGEEGKALRAGIINNYLISDTARVAALKKLVYMMK